MCELVSVVSCLKSNKSPGPDGIPYEFYKYSCHTFLIEVLNVFNFIFLHKNIPDSFKESIIIHFFKKGDPNILSFSYEYKLQNIQQYSSEPYNNVVRAQ